MSANYAASTSCSALSRRPAPLAAATPARRAVVRGDDFAGNTRRGVRNLSCSASADDDKAAESVMLPIFPLGMVALPNAQLPLQIFEARYRVLFSTLLAGSDGVVEDLVTDDSPFKGTKRFGMCYANANGLSQYGTVLEITSHQCMEDGRMLIETTGRERFTIQRIEAERPVLLAEVQMLTENADEAALAELADEVKALFRDVMRLNGRYKKIDVDTETLEPPQLDTLKPSELSFWMVSMFAEAAQQQQKMLEMESAQERLEEIKVSLTDTVKYLSAALALEGAFASPEKEDATATDDDGKPISEKKESTES